MCKKKRNTGKAIGIIRWTFLPILLGAFLCGTTSAVGVTNNITVMSFNILYQAWAQSGAEAWDSRKVRVFETIQAKSPDFVGTQEENGGEMEEIIATLPEYREVPGRGISGGILYLHEKWNLVDYGKTIFVRYEAGDSKDRYFIWGLFTEKETNRAIYIYSHHLPTYKQATLSDRVECIKQMATHAENRQRQWAPVILTGDFNATTDTDVMRTLTGEIGTLTIEFIYAYQDVKQSGVSYGIDHILALPGTTVVESGLAANIWDSGSDHPAVFAVIEPWFGNLSGYPDDNHEPAVYAGVDRSIVLGIGPWTPAEIAKTAWYDASDTNTISASGGAVSVWQDKSGNTNHATQNTSADQPVTGGAINSLNAIDFNTGASKQHLVTTLEQLTTVSIYLLVNPTARGVNGYSAAIGASAAGYGTDSGLFWPIEQYADATERNDVFYTGTILDDRFCNGVKGSADHNFQPVILSHQGTNLPTANLNYLIGNRSADLLENFAYKGLMGEIIICPEAHDEATRLKMEGYLAHKWGLATNLPDGHPYKDSAPQGGVTTASVTLTDATVSDVDAGDPLTQSWELISKPAGAPDPVFNSSTVVNPTVTFTATGTNILRLTATDGYATVYDEVIIIVTEGGSTTNYSVPYAWLADFDPAWSNDYEAAVLDDQDGDGYSTWQEYWSGTDPMDSNSVLKVDSIAMIDGSIILQWRHAAIRESIPPIEIQVSTNLISGNWSAVDTHVSANGTNSWSQTTSPQVLYYRLKAPSSL